jgi:hypothetical protein
MPLWLPTNTLGRLASLSFSNNDKSHILTGIAAAPVTDKQTWPAFEVPYRVRNGIDLGATLTLQPDVTIEFQEGVGVEVGGNGRLTAEGVSEEPITLNGIEQERGFWAGVYFHDTVSEDNLLHQVVVEYAGGSKWTGNERSVAGVFVSGEDVALDIENTTFRENTNAGLHADSGAADLEFSNKNTYVLVGVDEPSTNVVED